MTTEFLHRIRKELTITLTGLHETVIAVSERVNRKVQILKLHWQASVVDQQIEAIHQRLGEQMAALLASEEPATDREHRRQELERHLAQAASRIRLLRGDLTQVEALMRELEAETLRETLLTVQHDLFTRAAALERVVVGQGAVANGRTAAQLGLAASTQIVAILRGAALLSTPNDAMFRPGDIVILVGRRDDLPHDVLAFTQRQRALA